MGDMVEEMDQKRRQGLAVIAGRRFLDDNEPQRTQSGLQGRSRSYKVGVRVAPLSSLLAQPLQCSGLEDVAHHLAQPRAHHLLLAATHSHRERTQHCCASGPPCHLTVCRLGWMQQPI